MTHIVAPCPSQFCFVAARWVQFCIRSRVVSKYVAGKLLAINCYYMNQMFHLHQLCPCIGAYVSFAVVLCEDMSSPDAQLGHRVGKLGMKILRESDLAQSELSQVYVMYYGFIGILFEPIQACIDMERQVCSSPSNNAAYLSIHKRSILVRSINSGVNLLKVKEQIDIEIKLAEHLSFPRIGATLSFYQEVVVALIGDESSTKCQDFDDAISDALLFEHQVG